MVEAWVADGDHVAGVGPGGDPAAAATIDAADATVDAAPSAKTREHGRHLYRWNAEENNNARKQVVFVIRLPII